MRRLRYKNPSEESQHLAAELWEYPGHLAQQVVAIGPAEIVYARSIPPSVAVVIGRGVDRDRLHLGVEVRIEEKREGQPVVVGRAFDPVRCRTVEPSGHSIQHISDIAYERIGNRFSFNPTCLRFHL